MRRFGEVLLLGKWDDDGGLTAGVAVITFFSGGCRCKCVTMDEVDCACATDWKGGVVWSLLLLLLLWLSLT